MHPPVASESTAPEGHRVVGASGPPASGRRSGVVLAFHQLTAMTGAPQRRVLLALRDDRALAQRLLEAGAAVASASDRSDLRLKVLRWQPSVVVAEADSVSGDLELLADVIQGLSDGTVEIFFTCRHLPRRPVRARSLLNPQDAVEAVP